MAFGMVNVPGLTSVNGHTGDVTLTAKDVGALSDSWKPGLTDLNDALAERKVNGKPLNADVTLTAADLKITPLLYGANGEAGKFDTQTTAPTATNALRYNGVFRATKVFGVYYSDSADLAEMYEVQGRAETGDLIAIGLGGVLTRNEVADNPRVLGFVSDAPGVVLGFGGRGVPVALSGRTPVKAVGEIHAGDFLSASDTPGAVRAVPLEDAPRGSVVAMALEDKTDGEPGRVLAFLLRL